MAARSSALVPQVIENATLNTGASTEKIPLMPQAQGTYSDAVGFRRSRAEGRRRLPRAPRLRAIRCLASGVE